MRENIVIAIDGPAAAGKGTLARAIAEKLNLAYLDTGSLYRAVGVKVLNAGGDPADVPAAEKAAETLTDDDLKADIRTAAAGAAASKVAAIPGVRAALLNFQRAFAARPGEGKAGAILDGRDVGTVVCPEADVKLFVTASAEARAHRRFQELEAKGEAVDFAELVAELRERDERDASRSDAPMKPAEDADLLDTSKLDIEAAFSEAMRLISAKIG